MAALIMEPRGAQACSCLAHTSEQAFAWSSAVFLGTVRGIVPSPTTTTFGPLLEVEIDVNRVWKGEVTRTQAVVTPIGGTVCGFAFQTGRAYLVYGTRNEYGLWTSLCSHTRATDQAAGELGFGPGSAPLEIPDAAPSAPPVALPLDAGAEGSGNMSSGDPADAALAPDSAPAIQNTAGNASCQTAGHGPPSGAVTVLSLLLIAWLARRAGRRPRVSEQS